MADDTDHDERTDPDEWVGGDERAESGSESATPAGQARQDGGTTAEPPHAADGPQDETLPDRQHLTGQSQEQAQAQSQPQGQPSQRARVGEEGQRGQQNDQQQPPSGPEENVQLDPYQIHQNIVTSMNRSETTEIDTEWGTLRYQIHMPSKGVYQAAVGSLPDSLIDWMQEIADEYGNDADIDDLIRKGEIEPPRIVFGEQVMNTFDRLLDECLEHDPASGNPDDTLTETLTRDVIAGMDPNEHTVPLGFQCIRLGSNRSGIQNFRMVDGGTENVASNQTVRPD